MKYKLDDGADNNYAYLNSDDAQLKNNQGVFLFEKDPLPFGSKIVKPSESAYLIRTKKRQEFSREKELEKVKADLGPCQLQKIQKE